MDGLDYNTNKALHYLLKFKKHWCKVDEEGHYHCRDCYFAKTGTCAINSFLFATGGEGIGKKICEAEGYNIEYLNGKE